MTEATTPQMWFHDVATRYVEAQVLFHLNQAGVLEALLDSGPISALALSEKLGLVPSILEILLDYASGVDDLIASDSEGQYRVTDLGRKILERYGRVDPDGRRHINLFDVRVGAYGPVWASLEGMLRGDLVYGRDVHRAGGLAAEGTYKISPRIAPMVSKFAKDYQIGRLVEIGVPTGLLALVSKAVTEVDLVGLDIDQGAIDEARARAARSSVESIRFVRGDLFQPAAWRDQVFGDVRGAFFTVHMHELASRGLATVREMVASLADLFPGWHFLAIEQDRLPDESRAVLPRDEWLYSQSNVLIHHLVKNAHILRKEEWIDLFTSPRSRVLARIPVDYLGYHGYVVELAGPTGLFEGQS